MASAVERFLNECANLEKMRRRDANEIALLLMREMNLEASATIDMMLALQGDAGRARAIAGKLHCPVGEEARRQGSRHYTAMVGGHRARSPCQAYAIMAVLIVWFRSRGIAKSAGSDAPVADDDGGFGAPSAHRDPGAV